MRGGRPVDQFCPTAARHSRAPILLRAGRDEEPELLVLGATIGVPAAEPDAAALRRLRCCRLGRLVGRHVSGFGPTNPSALLVVLAPAGEPPKIFEITPPWLVPSLHKLFTGVWKGRLRGPGSCHMLHRVMALTLLSEAGL